MKILLIEDNKNIAKNIQEYLELEGHKIEVCHRGDDGLDIASTKTYDLILLDLALPGADGIQICRQLRKRQQTPIIMITARESIDDRVLGLDTGASDYLVKPFDLRELSSRIKAVSRRSEKKNTFVSGDVEIDLATRVFLRGEEEVSLTQKEFQILEVLIKNHPNVISRTDIIDSVWSNEADIFGADGKLDVYISNLRSKLGKDFIKTIKSVGYKLS